MSTSDPGHCKGRSLTVTLSYALSFVLLLAAGSLIFTVALLAASKRATPTASTTDSTSLTQSMIIVKPSGLGFSELVNSVDQNHNRKIVADAAVLQTFPVDKGQFFEGHLSAVLPGPGDIIRQPGANLCLLEDRLKNSVLLKPCGTYDRLFDRLKGKEVNRTIFQWSSVTKKISVVSRDRVTRCLTSPSAEGSVVIVSPCVTPTIANQTWQFRTYGARHKRLGRLESQGGCLRQPVLGRDSNALLGQCDESCSTIWTFDETPHPVPMPRNAVVASHSSRHPKVLCWILTYPKAHALKAVAINRTWGRHCDRLLFMTTEHHSDLETVVLDIGGEEDRGRLWNKSREAWSHCYKNHIDDYDWFVKADDDTYVVYPHLLKLLGEFDSTHAKNIPKSFGRKFNATRGEYVLGPFVILFGFTNAGNLVGIMQGVRESS